MAPYKVFFTPSADRALRKLPEEVQRRIVRKVAVLAENPDRLAHRRGKYKWLEVK
jgi:mRNA-degrading endonuclease RelE of RelBE toxin-antitoxin system